MNSEKPKPMLASRKVNYCTGFRGAATVAFDSRSKRDQ
jgi:hypothetical protein